MIGRRPQRLEAGEQPTEQGTGQMRNLRLAASQPCEGAAALRILRACSISETLLASLDRLQLGRRTLLLVIHAD